VPRVLTLVSGIFLALIATAETLNVATATNFRNTLTTIAEGFESGSGHRLKISSASTGVIYSQLLHGAPYDVFLAADAERPRLLEERGLTVAGSRFTYARGELVLAVAPGPGGGPGGGPDAGLAALLAAPGLTIAIANPDHAPYGRAAAAVLEHYPVAADARLLRAANVGQAYQMWYSGGAELALVASSLAPATFLRIPRQIYKPIEQQAVVLNRAATNPAATAFSRFLRSERARRIMLADGYAPGPALE